MIMEYFFKNKSKSWYASQLNNTAYKRLITFTKILTSIMVTHVAIMMTIEGWDLWTAIWFTAVSIASIGYGDVVPQSHLGQFVTVTMICFVGIIIFAVATGDYVAYQLSKNKRMITSHWDWKMKNHILIINVPAQGGERYLCRIIDEMKKTPELSDMPVQILTARFKDGLPSSIGDKGVVHYHGRATSDSGLANSGAAYAKHIIVLADDYTDPGTDSRTLDVLDRLQNMGVKAPILAEYVTDGNGERFKKYAAAVMRPIRSFPEIICRAMIDPGAERILQDLFVHDGDFIKRYKVNIHQQEWAKVAMAISLQDMGVAIAYMNKEEDLQINPKGSKKVDIDYIYVMVKDDLIATTKEVQDAVSAVE